MPRSHRPLASPPCRQALPLTAAAAAAPAAACIAAHTPPVPPLRVCNARLQEVEAEMEVEVPNCKCGQPAELRTVKKEGPNQGRAFWG